MNKNEIIERIASFEGCIKTHKEQLRTLAKITQLLSVYNDINIDVIECEGVMDAIAYHTEHVEQFTAQIKRLKKALKLAEQYETLIA